MLAHFKGNSATVLADSDRAIVTTVGCTAFHVIASELATPRSGVRAVGWLCRLAAAGGLFLVALLLGPRPASAQPYGEVVVVPVLVSDGEAAGDAGTRARLDEPSAATTVETGLLDENVTLISQHDARDRFVARSRPPQVPTGSDLEALSRAAREALEHVAYGRTAAAKKSVQHVIALAERTLESLNRETATARNVLNACLSLVRGSLQEHKREAALAQAMQCRRLVPDLSPSEATHPANVVGVLAEADNLLRRMRLGSLQVQSAPDERCSVYVNGRHLGTTPFKLDRAATGEYRVQVECNSHPGRVHVVQLGDAPVRLIVDTVFDRIVESAPRLALRYASAQEARELSIAHACALGEQIGADDVVLVSNEGDRVVLVRVEVEQRRLIARAVVAGRTRASQATFQPALVALAEGRLSPEQAATAKPAPVVAVGSPPVPAEDTPAAATLPAAAPAEGAAELEEVERSSSASPLAPASSSPSRRDLALRITGLSAFGLGAAAVLTGAVYSAKHMRDGDSLRAVTPDSPELSDHIKTWRNSRGRPRQFTFPGAAVASIGAGLLAASDLESPAWLAALSAAGAVSLLGWGAVELVHGEPCDDSMLDVDQHACSAARDRGDKGKILMSSAVPFAVFPIALLVRHWVRPRNDADGAAKLRVVPSLAATRDAFGLSLHGAWF